MDNTITLIIAFCVLFLSATMLVSVYQDAELDRKKIEKGLEECPIVVGKFRTMWVKDCTAYTEMIHKLEKD